MVECDPVCSIGWLHNGAPIQVAGEEEEDGVGAGGGEEEYEDGGSSQEEGEGPRRRFRVRDSAWPPGVAVHFEQ